MHYFRIGILKEIGQSEPSELGELQVSKRMIFVMESFRKLTSLSLGSAEIQIQHFLNRIIHGNEPARAS